ncbi:hypothetical protein GAY31_11430 [Azospirillum brasilense]|nr:hypothetical protein [Azospirillum brasilense]
MKIQLDSGAIVEIDDESLKDKSPAEVDKFVSSIVDDVAGKTAKRDNAGRTATIRPEKPNKAPEQPKDRSYTSAFLAGVDAPLESIGETASQLGFDGAGNWLKGLTEAPKNYESATQSFMGDPNAPWYDPTSYNWSDAPRMGVEALGGLAGDVATRAGGAAIGGALGGPGGAAVGAFSGPALFQALQVLGPTVKARAEADGRMEPNAEDWAVALSNAGLQGAINGVTAARLFKGGLGNIVTQPAKEMLGGAAQDATQQVAETIDTQQGVTFDPRQAVASGVGEATGSGMMQVARSPVDAVVGARDLARKVSVKAEYNAHPDQVASDLRVADLFDQMKQAANTYASGKEKVTADELFKTIKVDLTRRLTDIGDALYRAGDIDDDGRKAFKDAISIAAKHNHEPGQEGPSSGYFETAVDRVNQLGLHPNTAKIVHSTLRDLNTVTYNSMKKNRRGPFERNAPLAATALTSGLGLGTGGPVGALVGAGVGALARGSATRVGRGIDNLFGLTQPDVLVRAEARRALAENKGLNYGGTVKDTTEVLADALTRRQVVSPATARPIPGNGPSGATPAAPQPGLFTPPSQLGPNRPEDTIRARLAAQGIEQQGGWLKTAQKYINAELPAEKHLSQADIMDWVKKMPDYGLVDRGTVDDLLTHRDGKIRDEDLFYGIQDFVRHYTSKGTSAPAPTPANVNQGGIRNPASYAATVHQASIAFANAATTLSQAPVPNMVRATMLLDLQRIADAKDRGEKERLFSDYEKKWSSSNKDWADVWQIAKPLTMFGPVPKTASTK